MVATDVIIEQDSTQISSKTLTLVFTLVSDISIQLSSWVNLLVCVVIDRPFSLTCLGRVLLFRDHPHLSCKIL